MTWSPSDYDKAWTLNMLELLKSEGATWLVPASLSAWWIHKTEKQARLDFGDPEHELNKKIAIMLQSLGYTIIEKEKP